eukprot:GDKK01010784.1.p1 GENE.GDKK01010784.1~~GDKK01010784.1.p1  ORF type:complete len:105 (-),score=19.74 GDKK01010784.1:22-336(-)
MMAALIWLICALTGGTTACDGGSTDLFLSVCFALLSSNAALEELSSLFDSPPAFSTLFKFEDLFSFSRGRLASGTEKLFWSIFFSDERLFLFSSSSRIELNFLF